VGDRMEISGQQVAVGPKGLVKTVPNADVPGVVRSLVVYGSIAHAIDGPGSDVDWRGMFQLENDEFLGLGMPTMTYERKVDDLVMWELGRFASMLLKANPNLVGQMFIPDDCIVIDAPVTAAFREIRSEFITQNMVAAYLGWAWSEMRQSLTPKRLSHVPRLLWEVSGAVKTGWLEVRPTGDRHDKIMAIRDGSWDFESALSYSRELLHEVNNELTDVNLPEPPYDKVEAIVLAARHGEFDQ
jgi:predicted nucleotidyltransferase